MLILEIPYTTDDDQWHLNGLTEGRRDFGSRTSALTYAMEVAKQYTRAHDEARICIQGADGTWRSFDETMKPYPI